MNHSLWK